MGWLLGGCWVMGGLAGGGMGVECVGGWVCGLVVGGLVVSV